MRFGYYKEAVYVRDLGKGFHLVRIVMNQVEEKVSFFSFFFWKREREVFDVCGVCVSLLGERERLKRKKRRSAFFVQNVYKER